MPVDSQLAVFIGTWRGEGRGTFPKMAPFAYEEEIRFLDLGRDAAFFERAWDPTSGTVMHVEAGIWRVIEIDSEIHVLVATFAQPRRTEVTEGPIRDGSTLMVSTQAAAVRGAKRITSSERSYQVSGDELTYEFKMATRYFSRPSRHLVGTLRRLAETPPSA